MDCRILTRSSVSMTSLLYIRTAGVDIFKHPMELFEDEFKSLGVVKVRDIPKHAGRRIRFVGWLLTGRTVHTKHGDPMEFLTFEDDTGVVETTFFPDAYKRFCHMIDRGRPYVLTGVVDQDWGATTLTVEKVGNCPVSGTGRRP